MSASGCHTYRTVQYIYSEATADGPLRASLMHPVRVQGFGKGVRHVTGTNLRPRIPLHKPIIRSPPFTDPNPNPTQYP